MVLTHPIFRYWHSFRFAVERFYNTLSHREYMDYYFSLFEDGKTWDYFEDGVQGVIRHARQHDVPLFPVIFPLFSHRLDEKYPFMPLHQKIQSMYAGLGVEAFDLYPSYKDIPPDRLQAKVNEDSHPNEIAYRIAAEAIYKELARRELIPADLRIHNISTHGRRPGALFRKVEEKKLEAELSKN